MCSNKLESAQRETRRDRLNESNHDLFRSSFYHFASLNNFRIFCRFVELGKFLEPGRLPKTDKLAILADAVRMVTQLQGESQKLKELNLNLQEKIKELKNEKNELRNEKQRLKLEKEKLEQQMKTLCTPQPSFLPAPPAIPAAFAPRSQASTNKVIPIISYPVVAMWHFMPSTAVDTSQDHLLRPPVA